VRLVQLEKQVQLEQKVRQVFKVLLEIQTHIFCGVQVMLQQMQLVKK
jgi:hypothetical protein